MLNYLMKFSFSYKCHADVYCMFTVGAKHISIKKRDLQIKKPIAKKTDL